MTWGDHGKNGGGDELEVIAPREPKMFNRPRNGPWGTKKVSQSPHREGGRRYLEGVGYTVTPSPAVFSSLRAGTARNRDHALSIALDRLAINRPRGFDGVLTVVGMKEPRAEVMHCAQS